MKRKKTCIALTAALFLAATASATPIEHERQSSNPDYAPGDLVTNPGGHTFSSEGLAAWHAGELGSGPVENQARLGANELPPINVAAAPLAASANALTEPPTMLLLALPLLALVVTRRQPAK